MKERGDVGVWRWLASDEDLSWGHVLEHYLHHVARGRHFFGRTLDYPSARGRAGREAAPRVMLR